VIRWYTGNSGAGKTYHAERLSVVLPAAVHLDGDDLREVWPGLGFSQEDRYEQCLRVARLAKLIDKQGYDVIVSVIAPYRELRRQCSEIVDIEWVYVTGGQPPSERYPYEPPSEFEVKEIIEGMVLA